MLKMTFQSTGSSLNGNKGEAAEEVEEEEEEEEEDLHPPSVHGITPHAPQPWTSYATTARWQTKAQQSIKATASTNALISSLRREGRLGSGSLTSLSM